MLKGNQKEEVIPDDEIVVDIRKNRPKRSCRPPSREFMRRSKESAGSLNTEEFLNDEVESHEEITSHQESPNKWKTIQESLVEELSMRHENKNDKSVEESVQIAAAANGSKTPSTPTPPWMSEWKSKKRIGRSNTFTFPSADSRDTKKDKTRFKNQHSHEFHEIDLTYVGSQREDSCKIGIPVEERIENSPAVNCEAVNLACKTNEILTNASESYKLQNDDLLHYTTTKDHSVKTYSMTEESVKTPVEISLQSNCNGESIIEPITPASDKHTKKLQPDKLMADVPTVLENSNSGNVSATLARLVEAVQSINENVAALRQTTEEINKAIQRMQTKID